MPIKVIYITVITSDIIGHVLNDCVRFIYVEYGNVVKIFENGFIHIKGFDGERRGTCVLDSKMYAMVRRFFYLILCDSYPS